MIQLGVDGGDFGFTEGIVESSVQNLRSDAEARGGWAVISEQRLKAVVLQVCVDVFKTRRMLEFPEKLPGVFPQVLGGFGLQCVLICRVGRSAADTYILHGLQECRRPGDARQFRTQALDNCRGTDLALVQRLQRNEAGAGIGGAATAGKAHDVGYAGIGFDDVDGLLYSGPHGVKRSILRTLQTHLHGAGILQRKKSFGYAGQQEDVRGQSYGKYH